MQSKKMAGRSTGKFLDPNVLHFLIFHSLVYFGSFCFARIFLISQKCVNVNVSNLGGSTTKLLNHVSYCCLVLLEG